MRTGHWMKEWASEWACVSIYSTVSPCDIFFHRTQHSTHTLIHWCAPKLNAKNFWFKCIFGVYLHGTFVRSINIPQLARTNGLVVDGKKFGKIKVDVRTHTSRMDILVSFHNGVTVKICVKKSVLNEKENEISVGWKENTCEWTKEYNGKQNETKQKYKHALLFSFTLKLRLSLSLTRSLDHSFFYSISRSHALFSFPNLTFSFTHPNSRWTLLLGLCVAVWLRIHEPNIYQLSTTLGFCPYELWTYEKQSKPVIFSMYFMK